MDPWTTRTDTSCWTRATGAGLERFGAVVVDRPAATATDAPREPAAWAQATLRFDRWAGWMAPQGGDPEPESWVINLGDQRFELRLTDSGQVGLFPEQAANRAWIRDALVPHLGGAPTVLNLFAYTGAATLAAAAAARRSPTSTGRSRPSPGPAGTPSSRVSMTDRSAGSWMRSRPSSGRETRRNRTYDGTRARPAQLRPRWAARSGGPGGSRSGSTTSSTPARPSPAGTPRSPSCRPTRRASGRPSSPRPSLEPSGGLPAGGGR